MILFIHSTFISHLAEKNLLKNHLFVRNSQLNNQNNNQQQNVWVGNA
ncbi:MAG: hypothetical protein US13_C0005G0025 [candidate division TM6 bacterium GW2011_GWE2_36_25]|nr:MAG: hypothetical protein US03_C0005G0020 [candidate division TM6 bacterium GW2011_GWF2_36_131]KKQ03141.1 MAG: hypothetical protein US13_C0005G0025 [candidate division TM6 bacterium GW2011_GWE2_36_25]KKQ19371.1 MAG: hypothetical protein US32_C0010G0020 [candidate division TM6 bacterium GW2011_GWA2_36_9]